MYQYNHPRLTLQRQCIYSQAVNAVSCCWPVKQAADTEGLKGHTQPH